MEEVKKESESILVSIVKYLPLCTILVILFGLIKQYLYYFNFGVQIQYFVSITDLGFIVSNDLLILGICIFFLILRVDSDESIKGWQEEKKSKKIVATIVALLIVIGTVISILMIWDYKFFLFATGILIFFGGFLFTTLNFDYFVKVIKNTKNNYILVTLEYFLIGVFVLTSIDLYGIEHGKYNGTKVFVGDKEYTSSDSSYFIGKSEKYVFIYNKIDVSTTVIPVESVTKFDLKTNYKFIENAMIDIGEFLPDRIRPRLHP